MIYWQVYPSTHAYGEQLTWAESSKQSESPPTGGLYAKRERRAPARIHSRRPSLPTAQKDLDHFVNKQQGDGKADADQPVTLAGAE